MQSFSPEEAIDWVDQNAKQILGHTRKYLPFAPYDQEDFLQDAYEAALEASKISEERQIPFPACFWVLFKGKISDVTPNPGSKRNAGSCSPPSTSCDWSDFSTDVHEVGSIFDPSESLSTIDIDQVYPLIRHYLTPAEDRVLELLLGIHEGPLKIREAARHLGCSPPNVRQTLNRVCSRISALVESGELNIHFIDGEIVRLQPCLENNGFERPDAYQEVMAPALDPESLETKPQRRSNNPPEGVSRQDQPKQHHGLQPRRASAPHHASETKIGRTPHLPRGFVPNEDGQSQTLGSTSSQAQGLIKISAPGKGFWGDLKLGQPEKMTLTSSGNGSYAQAVNPGCKYLIHPEARNGPRNTNSSVDEQSSIMTRTGSWQCRNGPGYRYADSSADDPPVERAPHSPGFTPRRKSTPGPTCRNGPVYFCSDLPPDGHPIEWAQFRLAA